MSMIGTVDGRLRAMLPITLEHPATAALTPVEVWVDTASTGDLTAPLDLLTKMQLPEAMAVEAVLADGSKVTVNTYQAMIDWFGNRFPVEVVASTGQTPLLGLWVVEKSQIGHRLRRPFADAGLIEVPQVPRSKSRSYRP